jgi:glycosyltransferase involved in cell wall biosynthesis
MKTVLVYRDTILPISETFIKAQADAMTRYTPQYCGLYPASPSLIPAVEASLLRPDASLRSRLRLKLYQKLHFTGAFCRLVRHRDVALVHAHFAPDGLSALPLARSLGVPLIVTLHGYDVTKSDAATNQYRNLWEQASLFLCVSEFIRERALDKGFPATKLRVQYIGVDERLFASAPQSSSLSEKKVLFVGRLVEKKGCQYLIEAMQRVQATTHNVRLTIIGDGPLRSSLEKKALDLGVAVDFLGAQNSSSIRSHMLQSTVFCAPSVTASDGDSEGFGIVFLEAQAMGVPVVSFRHGGIPEAVNDGETGLLAPEGDVEGLAERLLHYLQDETARRAAGEAARVFVQEHFSLHRRTSELESIYEDVLQVWKERRNWGSEPTSKR